MYLKEIEMAKTDNIKSIFANKKILYVIVAVAVLLLGFGGYKWYEKHFTFAGAVVNNVYKVKEVVRVGEKHTSFTEYSTFKRNGDQILELYNRDIDNNKIKKDDFGFEHYDKRSISVVRYNKNLKKWKRGKWKDMPKITLTKEGYKWHMGNNNTEGYVSVTATKVD